MILQSLLFCFVMNLNAQVTLEIQFLHIANGKKIIQHDSTYTTPGGEPYTVSKLKYYITPPGGKPVLIDAFATDSFQFHLNQHTTKLSLLLGVDSILHCSGAQDGDLDPLNDMFWTWNTGYVAFKLEGYSDSSGADLQRIEHHVGGYRGPDKVMRSLNFSLPPVISGKKNKVVKMTILMNLDEYWDKNILIKKDPVIVTGGALARRSADNLQQAFHLQSVE
jgi:hypothetical protein